MARPSGFKRRSVRRIAAVLWVASIIAIPLFMFRATDMRSSGNLVFAVLLLGAHSFLLIWALVVLRYARIFIEVGPMAFVALLMVSGALPAVGRTVPGLLHVPEDMIVLPIHVVQVLLLVLSLVSLWEFRRILLFSRRESERGRS